MYSIVTINLINGMPKTLPQTEMCYSISEVLAAGGEIPTWLKVGETAVKTFFPNDWEIKVVSTTFICKEVDMGEETDW